MTERFLNAFRTEKPVIGMLHTLGGDRENVLKIAEEEINIMFGAGVSAVLAENYFGMPSDVEAVLKLLQEKYPDTVYGVNILGDFEEALSMAERYGAKFVQIDSVSGHLAPKEDEAFGKKMRALRERYPGILILGGVRFKYQPLRSGRTLEEDIACGKERCDAVVVTGTMTSSGGTGVATHSDKVEQFRQITGEFPLIIGAGITSDTVKELFKHADGGIVGSDFKYDGEAMNRMDPERVKRFMDAFRAE